MSSVSRPLALSNAISQEELDDAVQSNLAARASVAMSQAAKQQAAVEPGICQHHFTH